MSQRKTTCVYRNFCVAGVDNGEADMVFPPGEEIIVFNPDIDYGLLLTLAGVFSCVKAAHKASYKGYVPEKYNEYKINGVFVAIYNPQFNSEPPWTEDSQQVLDLGNPGFQLPEHYRSV